MERIVFYSSDDLSVGYHLQKSEEILKSDITSADINDVLEKYNVYKYINCEAQLKTWTAEDILLYENRSERFKRETYAFFNAITNDNIIQNLKIVDCIYIKDFWFMFDNCKLFDKISADIFSQLINLNRNYLSCILLYKRIVNKYDDKLTQYIRSKNEAYILLKIHNNPKLFLPKSITPSDVEQIFNNYIEQEDVIINILIQIIYFENKNKFIVSDNVRFKALNRYNQYIENFNKKSEGIDFSCGLTISKNQKERKLVLEEGLDKTISYSEEFLLETLDYPSILNNFIFLFEFADDQMRISAVSKLSQITNVEAAFKKQLEGAYRRGFDFESKKMEQDFHLAFYYNFLKSQNISLENVVEWFFKNYIVDKFKMDEIRVSMPSKESTYLEKCRTIADVFESVLKQYKIFVEEGNIDYELISFSSSATTFENVPSLVKDKYVYGFGDEFKNITFLLFSDQSFLHYFKNHKNKSTFMNIVLSGDLCVSDLEPYQIESIKYLIKTNILYVDENDKIFFENINTVALLYDLFVNEVVKKSFHEKAVEDLIKLNWITFGSTLLSKPEMSYFNFYLNSKEFSDGYRLRNKYLHGGQQVIQNQEVHRKNYFILLRLLILLVFKINDDLYDAFN